MRPEPTIKEIHSWLRHPAYMALVHLWDFRDDPKIIQAAIHREKTRSRPRKGLLAELNEWKSQAGR